MKTTFLKKYQDYCRTRGLKDEIFQMISKTNETLEEYVELFQYNLQDLLIQIFLLKFLKYDDQRYEKPMGRNIKFNGEG